MNVLSPLAFAKSSINHCILPVFEPFELDESITNDHLTCTAKRQWILSRIYDMTNCQIIYGYKVGLDIDCKFDK